MLKLWKITDYGGRLLSDMHSVFDRLPKALPWVEPSINCLHQESVLSLLVGNSECAILSMCALMEHVLRLAVINKDECGLKRPESMSKIGKYNSLSEIIRAASGTEIFAGCDEEWWTEVSKNIRNKSAHYLLPTILRNCAQSEKLKKYILKIELPENNDDWYYKRYITDWGAFYHSAGHRLAVGFLDDATEQLRIVINNTNWSGDKSWWKSLEEIYEQFFSYEWSVENIKKSFEDVYKERGRNADGISDVKQT